MKDDTSIINPKII